LKRIKHHPKINWNDGVDKPTVPTLHNLETYTKVFVK